MYIDSCVVCLFVVLMQCSFELSEYTANVDGVGTLRLLDAIRTCGLDKTVKFYQVNSSKYFVVYIVLKTER